MTDTKAMIAPSKLKHLAPPAQVLVGLGDGIVTQGFAFGFGTLRICLAKSWGKFLLVSKYWSKYGVKK